jgi:hypothetical protein
MDNNGNFKEGKVVDCVPHISRRKQRFGGYSDIFKSQGNEEGKQAIWRIIYEKRI